MKPMIKHALWVIPTVLVSWVAGIIILFGLGAGGHSHDYVPSPFPAALTFGFPYWAMGWAGTKSYATIGFFSFLQFPIYGGLLGWAWVKGKFRRVAVNLACVHFAATSVAFAMSLRGVRDEGATGVFGQVEIIAGKSPGGDSFSAATLERTAKDFVAQTNLNFRFDGAQMSLKIYTNDKEVVRQAGGYDGWKEVVAEAFFHSERARLHVKFNRHGYIIWHELTPR